jgi:hypothetical protein
LLREEKTMRKWIAWGLPAVVVSAFVAGIATAAESPGLKSGLDVGDFATPFNVKDITGPNKGKTLCYR